MVIVFLIKMLFVFLWKLKCGIYLWMIFPIFIFMRIMSWLRCGFYVSLIHNNSHKFVEILCRKNYHVYYQGNVPRKRCNNLHTLSINGNNEGCNLAYLCNPWRGHKNLTSFSLGLGTSNLIEAKLWWPNFK